MSNISSILQQEINLNIWCLFASCVCVGNLIYWKALKNKGSWTTPLGNKATFERGVKVKREKNCTLINKGIENIFLYATLESK